MCYDDLITDACVPSVMWGAGCQARAGTCSLGAWQHSTLVTGLSWCLGKYKDAQAAPGTSQPAGNRERERGEREEHRDLWREMIITTQWPVIQWWSQPCCGELVSARARGYQVLWDRVKYLRQWFWFGLGKSLRWNVSQSLRKASKTY